MANPNACRAAGVKTTSICKSRKTDEWFFPTGTAGYDRRISLSGTEKKALGFIAARKAGGGWHNWERSSLSRLLKPLQDALLHIGSRNKVRQNVLRIVIVEMHRKQRAYWGWSQPEWSNFFCPSWREFVAKYPGEKQCRSHLMAAAYLLELFDDLKTVGSFKRSTLAEHIFGEDRLGSACQKVLQTLETCGYRSAKSRPYGLRQCVSELLLRQRSPELANMTIELLEQTRSSSVSARFNHNLHAVSRALLSLGILRRPLSCGWRAGKNWIEGTATEGVPEEWAKWVDRWRETSALRPKTRYRIYVLLQQTGRWLGAKHPEACHPEQWTRDLAAKYVAAICQMKVGEWVRCSATLRSPSYGKPAAPRTRVAFLAAVRLFFRDCQEWEWIPRRFNPGQCLVPPRNLRALIKPNPRVIADDTWAKLLWAGLNLTSADLPKNHIDRTSYYPPSMLRAVTVVWLFAGLRAGQIRRLVVGCIRRENPIAEGGSTESQSPVCMLDVPAHKNVPSFKKPVDCVVKEAICDWERERPQQAPMVDETTGEMVHYLFACRNQQIGLRYLNKHLIPALGRKAGVPVTDARGRITSHRARSTIASQLYNAKEPMSLFELQEWLGHGTPLTTQHYAKISPTRLAKAYTDAGYFARNTRAIEVLVDRDVVLQGNAAKEPWRFYDLGHGYCTYDFFDQCPHRMACAKCGFYLPKESTKAHLLEGKSNLLRLRQEIPLGELELAAIDDGVAALENLVAQLENVPTPSGPTPCQLSNRLVQISPFVEHPISHLPTGTLAEAASDPEAVSST